MTEPVRLLIWDLDETFWNGTLTEGGHKYNQTTHDIVVELAQRGILSTICSKNDFDTVKKILEETGIWDYFIFPSINWEPKGPRIQALIETVQLRPETIMLIDDNPMNLKEALFFSPSMQTAPETFIPEILASPLFKGKDDRKLSRLNQYKLLERRKAEEAVAMSQAGGSNVEFLRSSNIRIRIEYDIEKHIDRAVELINRTNQLNFTKLRLPEDPEQARAALRKDLSHFQSQAGLVEVYDNYGNYGYCGFFLLRTNQHGLRLAHFCFSCRILNMGVEAWLYQFLGRPALKVVGEVLSDPINSDSVDWITAVTEGEKEGEAAVHLFGSVAVRGGCNLMPLGHYFKLVSPKVTGVFNTVRMATMVRLDHSLVLRHALDGLPKDAIKAFQHIGYVPSDFEGDYFDYSGDNPIWIFSNWVDPGIPLYRHKASGTFIPFRGPTGDPIRNFVEMPANELNTDNDEALDAVAYLKENFEYHGPMTEAQIKDNLRDVFRRVPPHGIMFVILSLETRPGDNGRTMSRKAHADLNRWTAEVAADYPRVSLLPIKDFVEQPSEIHSFGHFDRMVYFRLYQHITRVAGKQQPAKAVA